ncbi:unnamed protein product, partial [Ectocarpus sp. 12 AP-2014]
MGKKFGEPQTIAALRIGSMFQHGLVPYLGYNTTEALSYYQESADNGGMDAILVLAELHLAEFKGALEKSCKKAAGLYQKYANLCIKDGALAHGRLTFEQGQYQEAFVHYLIAAEQGNKEGQASLAWLLDRSMAAAPPGTSWPSSLVRRAWDSLVGGGGGGGGDADGGPSGGDERVEGASGWPDEGRNVGGSGTGSGSGMRRRWRSGVGGVADAVRQMGGDPEAMARRYRRLAAEQGDSEARCDIADHLYRQAKDMGAVAPGTGWLPASARTTTTTTTTTSNNKYRKNDDDDNKNNASDEENNHQQRKKKRLKPIGKGGIGATTGGGGGGGYGRESEDERLARESDAAQLLSDAVAYYRLAAEGGEREGGLGGSSPSQRGLFSLGWMHEHGVGVEADPALARELYRRSGSAPALLGLWMMGASDLALEIGAPLAVSAVVVAATMLAMRFLGKRPRGGSGRRRRQPVQVGAAAAVAGGRGRRGRRGGGG